MKNIAVILAGGIGSRSKLSIPKQYAKVAGKSVIEHTINRFNNHSLIDEIWVVVHNHYMLNMEQISLNNNWPKLTKLLIGGEQRYESSLAAIKACDEECNLIFHDSVRPLLSGNIIDEVIDKLAYHNAIDVAIPVTDTIIVKDGDYIDNIPPRATMLRGQTPQAFKLSVIKRAYELALQDPNFQTTDDCGVVKRYLPEEKIYIVQGEERNMKLTNKEDIFILDKLFQLQSEVGDLREPQGRLDGKVAVIFGGSYGIGATMASQLEELGARVYIFSRSTNGVDISSYEAVEGALSQVYEEVGRVDYVVDTAAILKIQPIGAMSIEDINLLIDVNYRGMVYIAKSAFPYLKESKGSLLLYTSSSYTRGRPFYSIYSSTKSAVVNFTQAISQEWDGFGITVNCVNPERTDTPMRNKNFGQEDKHTLLSSETVARVSINALVGCETGQIIDVRIE